jgi:hypothetical protein
MLTLCRKGLRRRKIDNDSGRVICLRSKVSLRIDPIALHEGRSYTAATVDTAGDSVHAGWVHHKLGDIFIRPVVPDAITADHHTY